MADLRAALEHATASTAFSGVVRVDQNDETVIEAAYGLADRAHGIVNDVDGQFAIASGTKGLTALAVVRLVEEGLLAFGAPARSLLGDDLPLVGADVTVEHLLSHRSAIGDYFPEDTDSDITDYVMPIPVHQLATTEQYLRVIDGHPPTGAPGERFAYNSSGYVVLALLAERAAGEPFPDVVQRQVCMRAGMTATSFLRSDELPARAAFGYLGDDGLRTNVLHLPVRGSGDGGAYSTVADVHALWAAMFAGEVVAPEHLDDLIRPRSSTADGSLRYGLGFWIRPSGAVMLEGHDAGVSFRTVHDRDRGVTHTVVSNTSDGAWAISRTLESHFDT